MSNYVVYKHSLGQKRQYAVANSMAQGSYDWCLDWLRNQGAEKVHESLYQGARGAVYEIRTTD